MFKIFDLNMNEIPFPDGLMPLEIFVGSIAKERISESVPGRPGVVDYGFTYRDRPVELFMRIKSEYDWHYRTLRNKIYELFDVGEAFYLAEADVPSRVLKVVVDESYIPDRLTENYADIDVICRTLDSVFWESIYTTKELHGTGYDAAVAKYGLVDNIDVKKVQYNFTASTFSVWNAGNVTVEPESMHLDIYVAIVESSGDFTVRNKTTGEEMVLKRESNGSNFRLTGMNVSLGSITNILRDTNRQFISLAPGENEFEVLNGTFTRIQFDFKFYYK